MMPLLVIFQIPAASHIARIGFKRFVYAGWGTRVVFIFAMALVPGPGLSGCKKSTWADVGAALLL